MTIRIPVLIGVYVICIVRVWSNLTYKKREVGQS